jgi:hypothetical protein
MKECGKILSKALKEQTPPRERTRISLVTKAPVPEIISLKGKDVERMMKDLYHYAYEIDRFTWPVRA